MYKERSVSHLSYARKYRPRNFQELIDQEHIATTLTNAIAQDNLTHAYLFSGPRGIGKTSTARILSKALNCAKGPTPDPCGECISCKEISEGRSLDVLEIDGASNRGIDEIRTLRENVKFAPNSGRFKIYIIDEVHMLTPEAFNALLKTLEEPPAHVKFIFATTEPHKVLPTILSRCQRFDFRRISPSGIVAKLRKMCEIEKIACEEEALFAIARSADGSLRDAEVMVDQLNSFSQGKVTLSAVNAVLGLVPREIIARVAGSLNAAHIAENLALCDTLIKEGKEPAQLVAALLEHFRDMMLIKSQAEQLVALPSEDKAVIKKQSESLGIENILYCIAVLTQTQERLKRQGLGRLFLEMAIVKLSRQGELVPAEVLLEKIQQLEEKLKNFPGAYPEKHSGAGIPAAGNVVTSAPAPALRNPAPSSGESIGPQAQDAIAVIVADAQPSVFYAAEQSPISIEQIIKRWPQLIQMVKKKKMSLGIYLSEGRPLSVRKNLIEVGFLPEFELHRESLLENTNKKRAEEIAAELFGCAVRIDAVACETLPETVGFEGPREEAPEKPIESEESSDVNDIIQSAMDIFNGRLVQSDE
jgi:DNA polymerase-3 subunit gamma/tau